MSDRQRIARRPAPAGEPEIIEPLEPVAVVAPRPAVVPDWPVPRLAFTARPVELPPLAVIALHRLAHGPRPGQLAAFAELGDSDEARLRAYVESQLAPANLERASRWLPGGFAPGETCAAVLWRAHVGANGQENGAGTGPLRQFQRLRFLRAVHSPFQLVEILAQFWHDHFAIYPWLSPVSGLYRHFDEMVIRPHALGNFRELLGAVYTSTTMLAFAGRRSQRAGTPALDLARDLLRRHTLGPEVGAAGAELARVAETDIREAARCLTGWVIDDQRGEFCPLDSAHDVRPKELLGHRLPAGQTPLADGQALLDIVAGHPRTARFVARRLCQLLVSDRPGPALVASAAHLFHATVAAPDQLAQVVRHIVYSPAFRNTWGEKKRPPLATIAATLRSTAMAFRLDEDDEQSARFLARFEQLQRAPAFTSITPEGELDFARILLRRLIGWLTLWQDDQNRYVLDLARETPPESGTGQALVDYWTHRLLGFPLASTSRGALIAYMAQGADPAAPIDIAGDPQAQARLRVLISLIVTAPEFQWI